MSRELLQQALDALEKLAFEMPPPNQYTPRFVMLIQGIRTALASPEQPVSEDKPVASIYITPSGEREFDDWRDELTVGRNLLYTRPAPADQDARDAARWRIVRANPEILVEFRGYVDCELWETPEQCDAAADAAIERAGEKK